MKSEPGDPGDLLKPPYNWFSFGTWFIVTAEMCGWLPCIPHDQAPAECRWALGATIKETAHNYEQAEARFLSEIEKESRIILPEEARIASSLPRPSKQARYFLGVRAAVLEDVFSRLVIATDQPRQPRQPRLPVQILTIIPFPSLSPREVTTWFLIDWWRQWGRFEVAVFHHLEGVW